MARKSLQDLSGIAKTIASSGPRTTERKGSSAPALGALQGSLSAIREIDPALIDDWGPADRLDGFTAVNSDDEGDGFDTLKESISTDGQQVPILLRRSDTEGRFQVIYGRRRLRACQELGLKVRANVQDLDDATALLAKGLENAARRNLSFYEKARFAATIQQAGHDTATVRKVLGLSKSGLSHLTKVTENVSDAVGNLIGAAPKAGRPKWTALAEAFVARKLSAKTAVAYLEQLDEATASDARLDLLLAEISRRGARPQDGKALSPVAGVTIKSGKSAIAVSINKTGKNADFGNWLDRHLEEIITESYRKFTAVNNGDDT